MTIRIEGDGGELTVRLIQRTPTKGGREPDLRIEIQATCRLFNVDGAKVWIEWPEVRAFHAELTELNEALVGSASIHAESPEDFSLSIRSLDSLGHLAIDFGIGCVGGSENGIFRSTVATGFEVPPKAIADLLKWLEAAISGDADA